MRLSAHDASFIYSETASGPMHSVGITVLDGPATYDEIFAYYKARIHLVPRLRQKLVFVPFNLAHPKWVDDPDFDLRNHLKSHVAPPNTTLERARDLALEMGEPLLDRSRPLWLTYIIENVQGKTILAQMSHHAFVDGATAVAITTVLTDDRPDAPAPNTPPEWAPETPPSAFELWQEAVAENAEAGLTQAQALGNVQLLQQLGTKSASLVERMSRPVMQAPWNASLVGPKRKLTTMEYLLAEFKLVGKVLGAKINDVVVCIVAEGAARYLQGKGEVVENQYLRLMCPVDIRGANDDPLDMSGNKVSGMFPVVAAWPMPVTERLSAVCAEMTDIKSNAEAEILQQFQSMQPNIPPIAMAQTLGVGTDWDPTSLAAKAPPPVMPVAGARPTMAGFNFTCSNVPGVPWQQYVAGYPVEQALGTLMLGGNLGMGVTVGSFNNKLTLALTADPRLMPESEAFMECVGQAYTELAVVAKDVLTEAGDGHTETDTLKMDDLNFIKGQTSATESSES